MQLPASDQLNVSPLTRIFKSTSAAYKYFWFLSLLELIQKDQTEIPYAEVIARMFAKAWYPRLFFKLSFGKKESLAKLIDDLQGVHGLGFDASESLIISTLMGAHHATDMVKGAFRRVADEVPYRFLSPWISESSNTRMVMRSQSFENNCLYALHRDKTYGLLIRINPNWVGYLQRNYQILLDFTYWHLAVYLQARNPNVPNITSKVMREQKRSSLKRQREFWSTAIGVREGMRCVYTDEVIGVDAKFDLDHFLPWRFVAHDRLWNLVPIINQHNHLRLNSSKSDKLPDLDRFLPRLAREHWISINALLDQGREPTILEDYGDLGIVIDSENFKSMSEENFFEVFQKTYTPMTLIAKNMGFEQWIF